MSCNPIYPDESIQLLGVVFCGGKSTRMGTDKGLLKRENLTWVEIAVRKFELLSLPFCISINSTQKKKYSELFSEKRLVEDYFPLEGPLNGLLSLHNAFPSHDLLIIACDLIDVEPFLIQQLLDEFRTHEGEHDFFVFVNERQFEPLLGVYTREGLQKLTDLNTLNQLEKNSLKYVLELGNTYVIPFL